MMRTGCSAVCATAGSVLSAFGRHLSSSLGFTVTPIRLSSLIPRRFMCTGSSIDEVDGRCPLAGSMVVESRRFVSLMLPLPRGSCRLQSSSMTKIEFAN
jgi:hypothetical protein